MAFTNSFIYLNINKGASEVGKINLNEIIGANINLSTEKNEIKEESKEVKEIKVEKTKYKKLKNTFLKKLNHHKSYFPKHF